MRLGRHKSGKELEILSEHFYQWKEGIFYIVRIIETNERIIIHNSDDVTIHDLTESNFSLD